MCAACRTTQSANGLPEETPAVFEKWGGRVSFYSAR